MLRSLVLLLFLLSTSPLFAQSWEKRFGLRFGIAQYEAEGFRIDTKVTAPVFGGDFWLRRGRVALDLGVDGYQIKTAGSFINASADVQFLLGSADGPQFGIGVGPNMSSADGDIDFTFVPTVTFHIPAGRQQVYVVGRHHTSSANIDGDAKTTIFMAGVRFARW
ncbi:MAG TPA: hypothetical protein VEK57_26895 [Thermoanaerobaculia bacterium]|nr:hypothetical protein [Thermoanaerobaculia bacterium]